MPHSAPLQHKDGSFDAAIVLFFSFGDDAEKFGHDLRTNSVGSNPEELGAWFADVLRSTPRSRTSAPAEDAADEKRETQVVLATSPVEAHRDFALRFLACRNAKAFRLRTDDDVNASVSVWRDDGAKMLLVLIDHNSRPTFDKFVSQLRTGEFDEVEAQWHVATAEYSHYQNETAPRLTPETNESRGVAALDAELGKWPLNRNALARVYDEVCGDVTDAIIAQNRLEATRVNMSDEIARLDDPLRQLGLFRHDLIANNCIRQIEIDVATVVPRRDQASTVLQAQMESQIDVLASWAIPLAIAQALFAVVQVVWAVGKDTESGAWSSSVWRGYGAVAPFVAGVIAVVMGCFVLGWSFLLRRGIDVRTTIRVIYCILMLLALIIALMYLPSVSSLVTPSPRTLPAVGGR